MKVKKKRNRTKGHLLVENLNIITALNYDTYNTTEFQIIPQDLLHFLKLNPLRVTMKVMPLTFERNQQSDSHNNIFLYFHYF